MTTCKKVFTIPQVSDGGTCWFNALLSALFYSDGTSAYFKKIIPSLRKKTKSKKRLEVYDLLEEILSARDIKDIREFSKFYIALEPRNLLKILHEKDKKHFYFNPEKTRGHSSENYMLTLFQFLGIMDKVLFVSINANGKYFFSIANNYSYSVFWDRQKKQYKLVGYPKRNKPILKVFDEDFKTSDVDLVVMSTDPAFPWSPQQLPIEFEGDKMDLFGVKFKADSMLLTNFNHKQCATAHKVAGITCKNKRYLYNGWALNYDVFNVIQFKSCNLFDFDWLQDKRHFCMDKSKCLVSKVQKTPGKKMCFNIDRMKTFIYVRERSVKKSPVPKKPKQAPKKPKAIPKKSKQSPKKKPKESPDIKLADLLKKPKPSPKKPKPSPKKVNESPNLKLIDLLKKPKPSPKKVNESPNLKLIDLLKKAKPSPKKLKPSPDIKLADLLKKSKPKQTVRKPRCPNGSIRNKKTGKCVKK